MVRKTSEVFGDFGSLGVFVMGLSIDPRWAWEPYKAADWDSKKAGHLFRRAGFGATATELEAAVKAGPDKSIDGLLQGRPDQEKFDRETEPLGRAAATANNGTQTRAYWLYRK